jgi:hypothetical protein
MTRSRRWLFDSIMVLSLFIGAAAALGCLWHGTFTKAFGDFTGVKGSVERDIDVGSGVLSFQKTVGYGNWQYPTNSGYISGTAANYRRSEYLGLAITVGDMQSEMSDGHGLLRPETRRINGHILLVELSLWWIVVLSAPLPLVWIIMNRRRLLRVWKRKYAAGHCPNCGYDLRATPDRCPECGATPTH